MATFTEDVVIQKNLRVSGTITPARPRTNIAQEQLVDFPIDLTQALVHDDLSSRLPGTSATDDLAITGNTFGTNTPTIETSDMKTLGLVTRYSRHLIAMPAEYDPAETVNIRIHAGMKDNAADTTATVDVECYASDGEGGLGSDLCTTTAQTINSTSLTDVDFVISAATLAVGTMLDIRIAVAVNDAAGGSPVTAQIGEVSLLCDIRG